MAQLMSIVGDKIYLNPTLESDIPTLAAFMNDDHVKMFGRNNGKILYEKAMKEHLEKKENDESYTIWRKDTQTIIGDVGISFIDMYNRSGMIGIMIGGEENRGKGFGKEAMLIILKHGFIDINLESINLGTWEYNKPAISLYKKLGFKEIGRMRKARIVGNRYFDEVMMDMTSEEYFELYGNEELKKYGI